MENILVLRAYKFCVADVVYREQSDRLQNHLHIFKKKGIDLSWHSSTKVDEMLTLTVALLAPTIRVAQ